MAQPEAWVDEHGDALYSYALSRLRNPSSAEDVVQETFLAAIRSRDRFSGSSSARTWLIGILKHKIVDLIRKESREQPIDEIETLEAPEEEFFAFIKLFNVVDNIRNGIFFNLFARNWGNCFSNTSI